VREEVNGLLGSGRNRLKDARNASLALESRFDLAYNAAHALSLAALRWHGYRSEDRYLVFQALVHTVGLPNAGWRVLDLCHQRRNRAEYEGRLEMDEKLLGELIGTAERVLRKIEALGPIPAKER
jgi:hypothetical protein